MSLKTGFLRIVLIWIFFLIARTAFSQSFSSKNNYTGEWETPETWLPIWTTPQTNVFGHDIDINGYITTGGSLSFSGSSKLTVKDTLVIKGNLSINNNNDLKIEDNGILIVWGNLTISHDTHIEANGYIIVTGNIIKVGDVHDGEFKSNDNPVRVFVGGTIPPGLTNDNNDYKALNCTDPNTIPYPNSTCSYGNMTDLINDPIYPFFQSTCSIATPTITAGGPATFCSGGSVTLTSSPGTTYLWSNGSTTPNINVSTSGNYTVRVTNASGCQSASSVATIVTVNALPANPIITASSPTIFCAGGSVILTSSAGNTYTWSTGATTASINVSSSGSYTVRVTDANGCQSAASVAVVVTVNSLPATPNITSSGTTSFCAGGSVTLTSSAGSGYLWSTGATEASISVTSSGSYTVRVTDANGCQSSPSSATVVTVNAIPVTPAITAGGPTTFCSGGSVTLTSSAEAGYLWSNGATTPAINVTTAGNYTVQVTNASGCQSASSTAIVVTVNALPAMPVITAGGPTTFCAGGSVTLTSSPETDYLWSNAATTPGIIVTSPGSYSVRVTNANGCQSAISAFVTVSINALPIVNAGSDATIPNGTSTTIDATVTGSGPFTYNWSPSGLLVNSLTEDPTTINLPITTVFTLTATSTTTSCSNTNTVTIAVSGGPLSSTPAAAPGTVCSGETVQLYAIASGGTGTYTYNWTSAPVGFTSSVADPVANPAVTTTYNVAVYDGFTTVNSQVVVTVNAIPVVPGITPDGPTTFCEGGSVTLTSGPGTSYLWSNGATTPAITASTPGSYTVQVTNTNGCQSAHAVATVVTVNALPVTPTIAAGGPTTFCSGASVTLTSSPETTYLWSNGATSQSINVSLSGSYLVRVSNSSGCQSASSVATIVTVNALPPIPTITASGPITFCAAGSVTLTSSAGNTYLWSTGATTASINVTSSGSYTVRVTDANGCQSAASVAVVVTVNALPATPTITASGPASFCAGGSVTLTSSAGTSYLWSTGATTSGITIVSSGNYTVQVTDANGCQSVPSVPTTVTVNSLPITPTITAGGPTVFCTGGSVTLTSSTGTSYLWSNAAVIQSINVTTAGSYTVQVTNSGGCRSALSLPVIVTINALPVTPTINVNGPTTFCEGDSVTLTASAGTSYLWSNASTSQSINVTTSGSYTLHIANTSGCQSALSLATIVTVNTIPIVNITSSSNSMCISDQRTLTGNPSGGTFIISDGPGLITGNILSATGPGNINLEYIYTGVCANRASQSLIVNENVTAGAGPDQKLLYIFETQMEAESPQYGTGEWSLISGSGNINDIHSPTSGITELSIGENKFLWKVSNGSCEATDEVVIVVNDIVTPTVITPNEDGLNDELIFPGLTAFPGSSIIIYNRWGSEVFRSSDYKNDWNGKDEKKRDLQEDTYYYILKISNGRILKGFIEIKR
jgi:large repetitive protein